MNALVLLACDTVNYSLIFRIKHWFGISGTALKWYSTYLSQRTQQHTYIVIISLVLCWHVVFRRPGFRTWPSFVYIIHDTTIWEHCSTIIQLDFVSILMLTKSTFHLIVCLVTRTYSCCPIPLRSCSLDAGQ